VHAAKQHPRARGRTQARWPRVRVASNEVLAMRGPPRVDGPIRSPGGRDRPSSDRRRRVGRESAASTEIEQRRSDASVDCYWRPACRQVCRPSLRQLVGSGMTASLRSCRAPVESASPRCVDDHAALRTGSGQCHDPVQWPPGPDRDVRTGSAPPSGAGRSALAQRLRSKDAKHARMLALQSIRTD
jgi:hypothetical protein